jgi:transcriptional regulator with XRE-family HTH domain
MPNPNAPPTRAGSVLRDARRRAGLTQERLARLADCSTNYVKQFEAGLEPANSPTLDSVWRVVDAMSDAKGDAA